MSQAPTRYWDKRVSAAYLRMLGATQKEAARAVGRADRTLRKWEDEDSWALARQEARQRWLVDLTDASRTTLLNTIKAGNAEYALKILERVDDDLRPPKQQHEHAGEGGGAITIEVYGARAAEDGEEPSGNGAGPPRLPPADGA